MSIIGAAFALFIVLSIGLPLSSLVVFLVPNSELLVFLAGLAQWLLTGFLLVYVYAIVSGFVFTGLTALVTVLIPAGLGRSVAIWLLCGIYLVATGFYIAFGAPALWVSYLVASNVVSSALTAGPLGAAWLALFFAMPAHFLIVLIAYVIADLSGPAETLWRGVLIGVNAAMNFLLLTLAVGCLLLPFFGLPGLAIAFGMGLIAASVTFATSVMPTASPLANAAIKVFVGWLSWILPTNWLIVALGWLLQLINALSHFLLGLPYHPFSGLFTINAATIRWQEFVLFVEGGIGSNLWFQGPVTSRGAYNLGTFAFVHGLTTFTGRIPLLGIPGIGLAAGTAISVPLLQHEAGHNLNLTAFGGFFHLINAVDENIVPARGSGAYAERLAESNVPGGGPVLPMWN